LLSGAGSLSPLGYNLGNVSVTLDNNGLGVSGDLNVLNWGSVGVSGSVSSNGTFSLTGHGSLSPLGYNLGNVKVTLDNNGLGVSGDLDVANLGSVGVFGSVRSDGTFSLTGSIGLDPFGTASITLDNNGLSVEYHF
jgi:hypothetical protein